MITVPTTLVLGAGASMPYGFPSGARLREKLCDPGSLLSLHSKFPEADVRIFCNEFLHSGMKSIDAFLSRRGSQSLYPPHSVPSRGEPTFGDIGKAAIAAILINCERHESLFQFGHDHWYEYLWSRISDSLETFGENKLGVITFNYDRSLEYYLFIALQKAFGITPSEAAAHLKKIPIIHVYGQLAELTDICDVNTESRHYSNDHGDYAYITAASRGIRVIPESRDDDAVFMTAREMLKKSKRACFLGFGFDPINLARLGIENLMHLARGETGDVIDVYATTIGLEEAERQKLINLFLFKKNGMDLNRGSVLHNFGTQFSNMKSEQYLKATGALS